MTEPIQTTTEYALMVDWQDGHPVEFVPANDAHHAEQMARTIYAAHPSWTVEREVPSWRYCGSDVSVSLAVAHHADLIG